jgi:hypothetical protein
MNEPWAAIGKPIAALSHGAPFIVPLARCFSYGDGFLTVPDICDPIPA